MKTVKSTIFFADPNDILFMKPIIPIFPLLPCYVIILFA